MLNGIGSAWRQYGLGIILAGMNKFLYPIFRHEKLLVYSISKDKTKKISSFPDQNEISIMKEKGYRAIGKEIVDRYILKIDGRKACYGLVSRNKAYIKEISKELELIKGEIYIHGCFVSQKHRGKGLYPYMLHHILKNEDFKKALIACSFLNKSSIRGIEKAGFKLEKTISYDRLLTFDRSG